MISGAGSLRKEGDGTLRLSGSNTYTGSTFINDGTVVAVANDSIPDSFDVVIAEGARLLLHSDETIDSLSGDGNVLLVGNRLAIDRNGGAVTFDGRISTASSGAGGITKKGTHVMVLSNDNNDYDGTTIIDEGTLRLGNSGTVPASSDVVVNGSGIFDLNGFDESVGSLAGDGSITLGGATLITGRDGGSTTFSGILSGTGDIVKNGSYSLNLSGDNTYPLNH